MTRMPEIDTAEAFASLRSSLSFVETDKGPAGNWLPGATGVDAQWEADMVAGRKRLAEIKRLSWIDANEARLAIKCAITSPSWGCRVIEGYGIEDGFAEAVAHAAVSYMRRAKCPTKRRGHEL